MADLVSDFGHSECNTDSHPMADDVLMFCLSKSKKNCSTPTHQCICKSPVIPLRNEIIYRYPLIVSFLASNAVYLVTLIRLKTYYNKKKSSLLEKLAHGTISAIISAVVSRPLWVAKSRLQHKKANTTLAKCDQSVRQLIINNNMLSELVLIGRTEGMTGLWSDCWASVISASINSPLQTLVHEALRSKCQAKHPSGTPPNVHSLVTAVSLMVVSRCTFAVLTYPLWLVQYRQRVSALHQTSSTSVHSSCHSSLQLMQQIVNEQGPMGLFKGIKSKLIQTFLLATFLAFTHPKVLRQIFRLFNRTIA